MQKMLTKWFGQKKLCGKYCISAMVILLSVCFIANISIHAMENDKGVAAFVEEHEIMSLIYEDKPSIQEILDDMPEDLEMYLKEKDEKIRVPVRWETNDDYETTPFFYYLFYPVPEDGYEYTGDGERPYITVYVNQDTVSASSVTGKAAEDEVFRFLTNELGLNVATACGILANIENESSFNPTCSVIDTNGLTSYGLCQWNGSRFTALKNYCGSAYTTVSGQMSYLRYELQTSEKNAWNQMQGIENSQAGAYDAGIRWAQYFERCAAQYRESRGVKARDRYWPEYGGYVPDNYTPGMYRVNTDGSNLMLRNAPSGDTILDRIPNGTELPVSQISDRWGKTVYNGQEGWMALWYCVRTGDLSGPSTSVLTMDKNLYRSDEEIVFRFSSDNATAYTIGIDDANGNRLITESCGNEYRRVISEPGSYSCYVTAYNNVSYKDSARVYFRVYSIDNTYGDDFFAFIIASNEEQAAWYHLINDETSNVRVISDRNDSTDPRQIWHFIRTPDNAYTIYNCYDGSVLDADGNNNGNQANVQTWASNGSNNQKWNIVHTGTNRVTLKAWYSNCVLDVYGGVAMGGNVNLYEINQTAAQDFSIYKITNDGVTYSKPERPDKVETSVSDPCVTGKEITFSWTPSPEKNRYDKRWYDLRIYKDGVNVLTQKGITECSYRYTAPEPGNYSFTVAAVNPKYSEWFTFSDEKSFEVLSCAESIRLDKHEIILQPGQTMKLNAAVSPSDAAGFRLEWSSDDGTTATVADDGVVTARKEGTTLIRVEDLYSGSGDTCTVKVIAVRPDAVLPDSLNSIGDQAFENAAFTYVVLSENTVRIGSRAFAGCKNLRQIYIPAETGWIEDDAFEGTDDLIIRGEEGSYANFFAEKKGYIFIPE